MKNTPAASTNGKVPHTETPRDRVLTRLAQVENWVSSPTKRPGTDARSRLQSLFDATDQLNYDFASLPKGTFGVNETTVSRRIARLIDFCTATDAGSSPQTEYHSSFEDLSTDAEPDFVAHADMKDEGAGEIEIPEKRRRGA